MPLIFLSFQVYVERSDAREKKSALQTSSRPKGSAPVWNEESELPVVWPEKPADGILVVRLEVTRELEVLSYES
jgi:hypothetical protein